MLTTEGLIVRTGAAGSDNFHKDAAFLYMFCIHDCYYGMISRTVDEDEEFEILHEIGSEEYKKVVRDFISQRVDAAIEAQRDVDLLHAYMKFKP